MKKHIRLLFVFLLLAFLQGKSQKITYSEPDRDDPRIINFEIVGRINGKVLVYKTYRDQHYVTALDADMKMESKNKLELGATKVLGSEFIVYPDFAYMIYQYVRRSALYCMAVKFDYMGKQIGDPVELDTTEGVNFAYTNRIYSVVNSEDKQKLMIFKINSKNDKVHVLTTCLFDKELKLLKKSRLAINMPQRNDFLAEFTLDNDGDLACIRASGTAANDNINKVSLITKPAMLDQFTLNDLKITGIFLDDIRIKADNINKHYLITSFVSKIRRGNIEGLYYTLWDKIQNREILNATTVFSEELRADAKGDGNVKTAFNDFFLKNIILRKDGGFIVIAESAYTSSRGNNMNRWDYLYGSPYWSPADYYSWRPMMANPWAWGYGNPAYFNSNNLVRYFSDNIAIISFEPNGKMEWSNIIRKTQFDDNTDNFIGYGLMNAGDKLHFIFNTQERRTMILSDQSISPSGQIDRNPTFKNMDKGYDFMPRHLKQVGSRQVIVPCQFRGYTCFAKIEF